MKVTVSITREFDTDEFRDEDSLYPGSEDLDPDTEIEYCVNLFAEDIDYLVKYDQVIDAITVEYIEE